MSSLLHPAQLDVDGDGYIDTMSIFGVSSGNYMLAAAIDNGYCKLDRAVNDVVWNVIEVKAQSNQQQHTTPQPRCSQSLIFPPAPHPLHTGFGTSKPRQVLLHPG